MAESFTPKQRMLNAYRGIPSDRYPVAPEFWNYFPAKALGMDMIAFEREAPFWQSLQRVFRLYGCEGWGVIFPKQNNERVKVATEFKKLDERSYRETVRYTHDGNTLTVVKNYDRFEPSWLVKRLADEATLPQAVEMLLCGGGEWDFAPLIDAHRAVGEDYLLEVWTGVPFFDFIAEIIGFEQAVCLFADEDEAVLEGYRRRYTEFQLAWIERCATQTPYESYAIGCSYSCNSLLGPQLWRKWDKPYIAAVASALHRHGKLLHIHFHGKSSETARDFAEIGVDCVCPFERPPGGDIAGAAELARVRRALDERVTFNGNIHTVETLIRGTPERVRAEIDELAEAFSGSARLIIGTGDQVGYETREENIREMIEYAKSKKVRI